MQETEVQAFRIPSSSTVPRWPTSEPRSERRCPGQAPAPDREENQASHASYEDRIHEMENSTTWRVFSHIGDYGPGSMP